MNHLFIESAHVSLNKHSENIVVFLLQFWEFFPKTVTNCNTIIFNNQELFLTKLLIFLVFLHLFSHFFRLVYHNSQKNAAVHRTAAL